VRKPVVKLLKKVADKTKTRRRVWKRHYNRLAWCDRHAFKCRARLFLLGKITARQLFCLPEKPV
jgi:hypothetical protein